MGTLRAQIYAGAQAVGLELFTQKTSHSRGSCTVFCVKWGIAFEVVAVFSLTLRIFAAFSRMVRIRRTRGSLHSAPLGVAPCTEALSVHPATPPNDLVHLQAFAFVEVGQAAEQNFDFFRYLINHTDNMQRIAGPIRNLL